MDIGAVGRAGSDYPRVGPEQVNRIERARGLSRSDEGGGDVARALDSFQDSIARLRRASGIERREPQAPERTGAVESERLGLQSSRPAARRSSEALNVVRPAEVEREPAVATATSDPGARTAQPVLTGDYNGAFGDTTLTFEVRSPVDAVAAGPAQSGVGGAGQLEVRDGDGEPIASFELESDLSGQTLEVGGGLRLEFEEGGLAPGDSFRSRVIAESEGNVDPEQSFQAEPGQEPGPPVGDGQFVVEGVPIDVRESDSIRSVLERVSESEAGVDARFDEETQRVSFTQRTPGAAGRVDLGDDTSGFLSAVGLDEAPLEEGADEERTQPLSAVERFRDVRAGKFEVGGHTILVDPAKDSLDDVLSRIGDASPEVRATYVPVDGLVRLETSDPAGLRLSDGTSGLLSALGVEVAATSDSSDAGSSDAGGESFRDSREMRKSLEEFARSLNELRGEAARSERASDRQAGAQLGEKLESLTRDKGSLRRFGLSTRPEAEGGVEFRAGGRRLSRALEFRPREVVDALFGDGADRQGLVGEALVAFGRDGLEPGSRINLVA